jgi:hypothetical protein
VHEHSLTALNLRRAVQELVGCHVRQNEAHDFGRIQRAGHFDRVDFRQADALGVSAPDGERCHSITLSQPRAPRAELLDAADELVAGREWWLWHAEIGPGAQLGIRKRHPRG